MGGKGPKEKEEKEKGEKKEKQLARRQEKEIEVGNSVTRKGKREGKNMSLSLLR